MDADSRAASSTQAGRLNEAAIAYVETERRISRSTLAQMPVGAGTAFFPGVSRKLPAIAFRYPTGLYKFRAYPEKEFVASKGFEMVFWNLTAVLKAAPDTVYITEGEFDALALVEAGIPAHQVLSVPGGAKVKAAENAAEQRGYEFVTKALEQGLNKVQKFVMVGDNDGAGFALRMDLVQIIGPARFYFVDWPEGVKDANFFLKSDGPAALFDLVTEGHLPWPVEGLYRMSELPDQPPLTPWNLGFFDFEGHIRVAPGTWSVVTGHPGHGKTVFWAQAWFNIVREYGVRAAVCSFETRAKPHLRRHLRTFYWEKLERYLTEAERKEADAFINDMYLFMQHPAERPTLKWLLDTAEVAVIRHGCRILQLDPWNRVESQRPPQQSETDYIGEVLREVSRFCRDFNVHFQILAHPAKSDPKRRGIPPELEDISGSKNWDNMTDQGFVIHRPAKFKGVTRETGVQIICRKTRFDELGHECAIEMEYDINRGLYVGKGQSSLL